MSLAKKRILIAKPGLDGHDVGAKVIAMALRDSGADVIYTGLRKSPDYIAAVAVDEGVHAIGLSILSGSHLSLVADVIAALAARGAGDVAVFLGGTIPQTDHHALFAMGVRAIFTTDETLDGVVARVDAALAEV